MFCGGQSVLTMASEHVWQELRQHCRHRRSVLYNGIVLKPSSYRTTVSAANESDGADRILPPFISVNRQRVSSANARMYFPLYVEVDQIYNLACPASPIHYQHDPVQTTKTSVHGAINMLALAKRLRAKILQERAGHSRPQVGLAQPD